MINWINSKFAWHENRYFFHLLLAGITLLALALRFYRLGEWSFWGDELYTIRDSQNVFNLSIIGQKPSRVVTHFVLAFLGVNEWSARLFPALIGAASVPLFYFPIKKIFGPGVALLASLFLAVSPWHLYWSQNARFYTPLLLFYTLGLLAFYITIEEDHLGYLFLVMVFMGLAVWEHLTALIFGPIAICYFVLLKLFPFKKPAGLRLRNVVILFVPASILGIFFILPRLQNPTKWLEVFGYVNNTPFWILAGVVFYVGLPVICMGALGALYLLTQKSRAALLLILGSAMPLLALMAGALVQYSANRYAFVSLSSWIILAAVATKELWTQTQRNSKLLAIGALSILLLAPIGNDILYYRYQNGNRDNWKAAFAFITKNRQVNEPIVVPHRLVADFYLEDESICMCRVDLVHIEADNKRVWFVEDMTTQEKFPEVFRWFGKKAQVVAIMDVHVQARNFKMRVYLYDPQLANPTLTSR